MSRETAPRLTTMSLSAVSRIGRPWQRPLDLDQGAGFEFEFAVPDVVQRAGQFVGRHGGEKTEAADVDAEHGRGGAGDVAGGVQHGAVAAEDEQQIHFAAPARRLSGD